MTQTEAIRAAFAELGANAERSEVERWAKRHGVKVTASFGSLVARLRPVEPIPVARLKALRDIIGDREAFLSQMVTVRRAVELAGGWDELAELLDLLK
jgi:hypothetical protein